MIVPHASLDRRKEGSAALSVVPRSSDADDLSPRDDGIDARIVVGWDVRLRFTRSALEPGNGTLRKVVAVEQGQGAARVLAVIDEGLQRARPSLADAVAGYARAHDDRIALVREPMIVPGGERAKNDRSVFDDLARAIHDAGLCRRSYVLAIGGGAVLDVAGFAAATAHRGVRLIRMPSTTLSQGDSGVGVKNSINAFGKKNFLGAFAPPWAVINDATFLTTLTDRDWRAGLSECVKVALVKDASFFHAIVAAAPALVARDLNATTPIIRRSADLHLAHIVNGGDPFELTAARPLDFGHWAAHKIEQMTDFEVRHGEAVSIGVALDSTYSMLQGWLSEDDQHRIINALPALGLPTFHDALRDSTPLLDGLEEFREHLGGPVTLTMLRRIGEAFDVHSMDPAIVLQAIDCLDAQAHGSKAS